VPVDYQALRERRLASLPAETRSIYEAQKDGLSLRRLGIERFRTLFAELMSAGRPANDVTTKVETRVVEVPTSTGIVATKIYIPHGQREPVGVYVHMHGGGWIAGGGFEAWDSINAELAVAWGCAIAHPDFRLAPESKFPGPSMDCYAAAEWIGRHGDKLGLDSRRIAVGGGCTGANLAAVVALMARDAGTPRLAGQCLFAPQMDCRTDYRSHVEFGVGYGLSQDDDLYAIEQYLDEPEDRWDWHASPVLVESVCGVAPAIFAVGEYEILRDGARLYANRLRDSGVEVHYFEGAGQGHGHTYWRNPQTGEYTDAARQSQAQVDGQMRRFLGSASGQSAAAPAPGAPGSES
jgi:acetyl esterase